MTERMRLPARLPEQITIEEFLTKPNMIYRIAQRLNSQGYIGDIENKLATYVMPLTRGHPEKEKRLCALITGVSGAGKSTLVDIVRRYYPKYNPITKTGAVMDYSRITSHAPEYLGGDSDFTMDDKILLILEFAGAGDAMYSMRIMSDPLSGGLRLLTTAKEKGDRTHKATEVNLPGMPNIFSTTTRVSIEPGIERRFYRLHPSDTVEQTDFILGHKAKKERDIEFRDQIRHDDEILKAIPNQIKPKRAVIPFSEKIKEKMPKVMLARSDIDKIFAFAHAVCILYQKSRLTFDYRGEDIFIVSPADFYYSWGMIRKSIGMRLSGVGDERAQKIFSLCERILNEKEYLVVNELMDKQQSIGLNYARPTISEIMRKLINSGCLYVGKASWDKRLNIYKLGRHTYSSIIYDWPNKAMEVAYQALIQDKVMDNSGGHPHWVSNEQHELAKKSLMVCSPSDGINITNAIISEPTRRWIGL